MRTRINIDSATPEQIMNLTRAYQNSVLPGASGRDDENPRVWVHEGGMGWESPSMTRQRAADVLREFDRLESGLFDNGAETQPSRARGVDLAMVVPSPGAMRAAGTRLERAMSQAAEAIKGAPSTATGLPPEDRPDTGTFEEMDERDGKVPEADDQPGDDQPTVSYYASQDVDDDGHPLNRWIIYAETYTAESTEPVGDPTYISEYDSKEAAESQVDHLNKVVKQAARDA